MFTTYKCSKNNAVAFLGGLHCEIPKMVGVALWKVGTTFPSNFGKTELDTLIQEGGFIGSVIGDSIENNNTEPTYAESIMKVRRETDGGRKGFTVKFDKSPCFQNELNKLNNSENWAFTPVLEDGSLFAYESNDGVRKPFASKLFVGMFMLGIMGVEEKGSTLQIDLMPKALYSWQNNGVVITNDEIDFTEVNPIAGVNITLPILTAAALTTAVSVSNLCSDSDIVGLTTVGMWKIERNGVLESPSAVSYNAGTAKYTLTHAAYVAGQKIRVLLSENGNDIVILDTNYYGGTSAIKTVV